MIKQHSIIKYGVHKNINKNNVTATHPLSQPVRVKHQLALWLTELILYHLGQYATSLAAGNTLRQNLQFVH